MAFDYDKPRQVSYCDGPAINGTPQLAKFSDRWAAWVGSTGVRVGKYEHVDLPADQLGDESDLFLTAKPTHLSISFSADALLAIAIQKDEDTIQIKRYVTAPPPPIQGMVEEYEFQGVSPILFSNWLLYWDASGNENYDLVCYYLDGITRNKIYARFQRENFAVEHIIHQDLPIDIDYLISTDVFESTKQVMLAKTTQGDNAALYSDTYGVQGSNAGNIEIEFLDGDYFLRAAPASPTPEDTFTFLVELVDIDIGEVEFADLTTAAVSFTLGIEFLQGDYE